MCQFSTRSTRQSQSYDNKYRNVQRHKAEKVAFPIGIAQHSLQLLCKFFLITFPVMFFAPERYDCFSWEWLLSLRTLPLAPDTTTTPNNLQHSSSTEKVSFQSPGIISWYSHLAQVGWLIISSLPKESPKESHHLWVVYFFFAKPCEQTVCESAFYHLVIF